MGIPYLTSFVKSNSLKYFENHQLKDTLVIIDGYALTNFLYRQHENGTSPFGGDYDIMEKVYVDFINLLLRCNVTPVFVFDGAYEQRKKDTIMCRMSNKIRIYGKPIKTKDCMPYLASDILFDILNDMDIPIVNCDFEADTEILVLCKLLNCPVISLDSDFYMNTVPYIPLHMINLDFKSVEKVIHCQLFKVEKLLNEFGGLNNDYLPLVTALLGNDYIKPDTFSLLLKLNPVTYCFSLKLERAIYWVRLQKDLNSAINNMTCNLSHNRDDIKNQIKNIIQDYKRMDSKYLSFILQHKSMSKYQDILKNYLKKSENSILPLWLEKKYRGGYINSEVMKMFTMKTIFFKAQIEDYNKSPYFVVSLKVIETIFGILLGKNDCNDISGIGRKHGLDIGQYKIKPHIINSHVPLADLNNTDLEYRKNIILDLIGIKIFNGIPNDWELFILILIYWARHTNNCKTKHMHALIVCAITLNIIKKKSPDSQNKTLENLTKKSTIEENIIKVIEQDCTKTMNTLKRYCKINRYDNESWYNEIIHPYAQFQSCVHFFMILNSLLDFPYNQCRIEKFFKGSFLYNLCVKMINIDPELFITEQLFNNADSLKKLYKSIISHLDILLKGSNFN